jgi:hypothetical protein
MPIEQGEFRIGYNLVWRVRFFLFALCMLAASIVLLVQSLLGTSEGLFLPSSVLLAAILHESQDVTRAGTADFSRFLRRCIGGLQRRSLAREGRTSDA